MLPLTAGFFCAVEDRGANVDAVDRVNFLICLSRSTSCFAAFEVDVVSSVLVVASSVVLRTLGNDGAMGFEVKGCHLHSLCDAGTDLSSMVCPLMHCIVVGGAARTTN